ncbi:hypothetical protein ACFY2V_16625 [Streptomyces eurythermus]|uniref:hypothetical protein n=1 Tax=Streptomyces eurythermus TaxID=42237 RepID=UPI00368FE963
MRTGGEGTLTSMLPARGDGTADAAGTAPAEPWVEQLGERGVRLHGHRLPLPPRPSPCGCAAAKYRAATARSRRLPTLHVEGQRKTDPAWPTSGPPAAG